jgi:hypothetical protein
MSTSHGPRSNPEGIAASSPRLRGTSNLGWEAAAEFNSNGVAAIAPRAWLEIQAPFGHNLFEVEPQPDGDPGLLVPRNPGLWVKIPLGFGTVP